MQSIWEDFLTIVREELGSRVVETWFRAVIMIRWDAMGKVVYLQTPNAFVCNWLEKNYRLVFQTHLGRLLNVIDPKIVFINAVQKKNEEEAQDCLIPISAENIGHAVPVKMYRPAQVVPHPTKK